MIMNLFDENNDFEEDFSDLDYDNLVDEINYNLEFDYYSNFDDDEYVN